MSQPVMPLNAITGLLVTMTGARERGGEGVTVWIPTCISPAGRSERPEVMAGGLLTCLQGDHRISATMA
jgi:hypothetical protein